MPLDPAPRGGLWNTHDDVVAHLPRRGGPLGGVVDIGRPRSTSPAHLYGIALPAFLVGLLLVPAIPLHAGNLITINWATGEGVGGGQFATPPGSCTAVPGGVPVVGTDGGCARRAQAAVEDWAHGLYGSGSRWSDLKEAALPPGAVSAWTGLSVPTLRTRIGNSWIPDACDRPSCGHLLKGDVEFFDENGDGKFDDTWIDSNFNGIRDNGEVDRIRAEQFAWGITSAVRDLSDLSVGVPGNVSPPGITRMSVRQALGDAALADNCDGTLANPECVNGVVSRVDIAVPSDRDPKVWGRCDPDRFTPIAVTDPIRAQRALDNCLWFFASSPNTVIASTSPDPLLDAHAVRDTWISERVVKYVASVTPSQQEFAQSWLVSYGFGTEISDISKGIYHNEWRLAQTDHDPTPGSPTAALLDTYASAFVIQHTALSRQRGYTPTTIGSPPTLLAADCAANPSVTCDGKTNPTVDPFWGEALLRDGGGNIVLDAYNVPTLDYNKLGDEMEFRNGQPCDATCLKSGVGREKEFTFMFEQAVEGYLLSCLDCNHPAPGSFGPVSYSFDWPEITPIEDVSHPPPPTLIFPVSIP